MVKKTAGVTPSDIATVVISEAKRNQRIKLGTALLSENASFVLSFVTAIQIDQELLG